jgi:Zn-dependent peptidase ImmA (M78 family)
MGFSLSEAAKLLGITDQQLDAFEAGTALPKSDLFDRMVRVYKQAESILLLPSAPEPFVLPSDYRTAKGAIPKISTQTRLVIRSAKKYLTFMEDLLEADRELLPSPNIPLANWEQDDSEAWAIRERARVGVPIDIQLGWPHGRESYEGWRAQLTQNGILVLEKPMEWRECRGFSLFGKGGTPLIVVNTQDWEVARTFTLFHEYGHLLLHDGAVCVLREGSSRRGRVEKWCNDFAAAFLMPKREFLSWVDQQFGRDKPKASWGTHEISRVAIKFRVSRASAALRLQKLDRIPASFYRDHEDELLGKDRRPKHEKPVKIKRGPGWRGKQKIREIGPTAASVIIGAWERQIADVTDIADVLDLSIDDFATMEKQLIAQA